MNRVAIIILTYNCLEEATKPCLESIYKVKNEHPFEIVVVDNLSTDGTRDFLQEFSKRHDNLNIIMNDENYGYAAGNNIGIKFIEAEYYILLNSDTLVTDYWIDKLISSFHVTGLKVGMVGPLSNNVGNEQKIELTDLTRDNYEVVSRTYTDLNKAEYFESKRLGFFCVTIKREVIDKIGLLDESFGVGMFEDDDYCLRAIQEGYKLLVTEGCYIYHVGGESFKKVFTDKGLRDHLDHNKRAFDQKHKIKWLVGDLSIAYFRKLELDLKSLANEIKDSNPLNRILVRFGGLKYHVEIMSSIEESHERKIDDQEIIIGRRVDEIRYLEKNIKNLHKEIGSLQNKLKCLSDEIMIIKSSKWFKLRDCHFRLRATFPSLYPNPFVFLKTMIFHPSYFLKKYLNIAKTIFGKCLSPNKPYVFKDECDILDKKRQEKLISEAKALMVQLPESYIRSHKSVVLQLDSFDKGGLEEVVLTLLRGMNKKLNSGLYIFVNDTKLGYLGGKAEIEGFKIILLHNNEFFLEMLIQTFNIQLVNLHYSIFGVDKYVIYNVPMVYTVHNNYIWVDQEFSQERRAAYQKIDKFIAVSDQVRFFFLNKFEIEEEKVIIIPNGLELESVKKVEPVCREEFNLSAGDFVFLNISSFNWNKFHILMLAAMQQLVGQYPHFKLLLVGNVADANCHNYIRREIEEKGLMSHIQIVDFIPKEKVMGLMGVADCFLLPSLVEGWSIAVMEAMYSKLPLILSDIGSARSVINERDIGIIIPNPYQNILDLGPNDACHVFGNRDNLTNITALCESMIDMHDNAKEWKQKAKIGKEKITQVYNVERMTEQYLTLFFSLSGEELSGLDPIQSEVVE